MVEYRAGYIVLFLALWVAGVPLVGQSDNEADKPMKSQSDDRQPKNTIAKSGLQRGVDRRVSEEWREMVLNFGKGIIRDQKTIGESLMKILDNEELSPEERIRAAELLGEMRYLPAIPRLMEHITLLPRLRFETSGLPIASALSKYGSCIIPPVVEAYANHKNDFSSEAQSREFGFEIAITDTNAIRTAEIYAKGLAIETDDLEKQRRIKKLLEHLAEYKK